jgi:hypothetical protein
MLYLLCPGIEMEPQQFSEFRHAAVHELMRLCDSCEEEFHLSSWSRWDYDLKRGTLTFSQDGVPKVRASIQVIGTTSISGGTWMWGWANDSLPLNVTKEVAKVREFGATENIPELKEQELPDDEHLGWGLTAVAAKMLGAMGAYRCPGENGFIYVVYLSIGFVVSDGDKATESNQVECDDHGSGFAAYTCEHLVSNPDQKWFSQEPDEEHKWPDAWCADCELLFQEQGEWNDKNVPKRKIKLLCHHCYEKLRSREQFAAPQK